MNDRSFKTEVTVPIGAVERDTGLSKDTLRVWERRYGFPQPQRDNFGERIYPLAQIDKLRVIKRLMDQGHRPGRIIALPIEELQRLSEATPGAAERGGESIARHDDLLRYMEMIKAHRVDELRRTLSQSLLRMGLGRFVTDVVAPLNAMVGDAWARGHFEIFEEHLYTESMQGVLRNAINTIPEAGARPRVLLTTLPNEAHSLGLLMAEAVFALEGAHCISLGVQTPIWDIVLAAGAQKIDIVALSFSSAHSPSQVLDGLIELRDKLPGTSQIWAGGSSAILHRRPPADVRILRTLADIPAALTQWRQAH